MIIDMSRGIDPRTKQAAERAEEAARQANSFMSISERFIRRHVRNLKSGAEFESAIRREMIPLWGDRPIASITRRDIIALVEAIAGNGKRYQARKLFAYANKHFFLDQCA
jgi:hypothetical protein